MVWEILWSELCVADLDDVAEIVRDDLVVAGLAERVAQPFETLVETVSGSSASGLDVLSQG